MTTVKRVLVVLGCLVPVCLGASPAGAFPLVVWNEGVSGDLPSSLGTLLPGVSRVEGGVGQGGGFGTGALYDRDDVQFVIAQGLRLDSFVVSFIATDGFLAFGLDRGEGYSDPVEFAHLGSGQAPFDLLQFDSKPGPQGASLYTFRVIPVQSTNGGRYALDLAVSAVSGPAIPSTVPEPATLWLVAGPAGFVLLMARGRPSRRRQA